MMGCRTLPRAFCASVFGVKGTITLTTTASITAQNTTWAWSRCVTARTRTENLPRCSTRSGATTRGLAPACTLKSCAVLLTCDYALAPTLCSKEYARLASRCSDLWCYVDADNCNVKYYQSSWVSTATNLTYSYTRCGNRNHFNEFKPRPPPALPPLPPAAPPLLPPPPATPPLPPPSSPPPQRPSVYVQTWGAYCKPCMNDDCSNTVQTIDDAISQCSATPECAAIYDWSECSLGTNTARAT